MIAAQQTPEWFAARVGRVTASRVSDVIATTKTGVSASRAAYLGELVAERLTGVAAENGYTNADMQRGTELEPAARYAYECATAQIVEEVGFVPHPSMMAGASPDGLVGDDGLVEIKCPRTHVHIEYLLGRRAPPKYVPQMNWQLICTGRSWCDFVSFDPRMPERLRLFVVRHTPTASELRELSLKVECFIDELDEMVRKLQDIHA